MFKNFDKVFKFTFKNQLTRGYKITTLVIALILFMVPIIILMIAGKTSSGDEDKLESCGADKIYVVDSLNPEGDFNSLNLTGQEGYTDIKYVNAESVEAALETISDAGEKKSFILEFKKDEGELKSRIILPEGSEIEEDTAENYEDFIEKSGTIFTIIASGASANDLGTVMTQSGYKVYDTEGYKVGKDLYSDSSKLEEQSNSEILPIFNLILVFASAFIIYMIIILYGNSILQTIILEKSSKLMDTMLISVSPDAMIFGKMLAVLASGVLQLLIWVFSVVAGVIAGLKIYDQVFEDVSSAAASFVKNMGSLGLFKPANVIIGILALIMGIIMYSSLAAVAGAISSSREEGASNQTLFTMILLICFYLVIFKGINTSEVVTWLYLMPFSSAMLLPAGICSGIISLPIGIAGLLIITVCSAVFIILAGKLYKMMSLYKGNPVNIPKALKMLFSNK